MDHLKDKVVLITGASRGIGASTARFLAEHGAKVALAARSGAEIEALAGEIGDAALPLRTDVGEWASVERAVADTVRAFGRLDGLVNNAGIIEPVARIDESDPGAWSTVVDVNLKGVYYGYRAALPHMLAAGNGTIINISSGAATGALEGWSHYCATKAGVLALTRCGHKEYGDLGIRVVGLSPGTVATDMQVAIKASGVNPVSQLDPSVHISPDWVAKAIGFLMGPGAERYLGTDFTLKTPEGRAEIGMPG